MCSITFTGGSLKNWITHLVAFNEVKEEIGHFSKPVGLHRLCLSIEIYVSLFNQL